MTSIEKRPPLAKSCLACRASKVKCAPGDGGDGCNRCKRLGLHCIFEESRRGRANKARDVARLGPCVRALLRGTAKPDDAHILQREMQGTTAADDDLLQFSGSECQRRMVQGITTPEGQLALLRHWLLIGVRSGSCGLLGNVLILAHSCQISLDMEWLQVDRGPAVPYIYVGFYVYNTSTSLRNRIILTHR